ncbi:MAG: four helix bundle protein, partial [Bacteroidota bacterium]
EYIRFLGISQGSLSELETLLIISTNLGFLDEERSKFIQGFMVKIRAQLAGLMKSLNNFIK